MSGEAGPSRLAVEARGLTRDFGAFRAVDDLDLAVAAGSVYGFLGPNGSGKTTTLRMLVGLLRPSAGRGTVLGHDLAEGDAIRPRVGYMSQRFSLYPDLSAEENLRFYAGLYGLRGAEFRGRRDHLAGLLGIGDAHGGLVAAHPGGRRQRVAFACAAVHDPALLLLDEPSSGMDPLARSVFWELLYGVAAEGRTLLVTSHFMEEAEQCDAVAVIASGRLVAEGPPAELRESLAARVVRVAVGDWRAAVGALEPTHAVALVGTDLQVILRPGESPGVVGEILGAAGVAAGEPEAVAPRLEDVFVDRVGGAG